MESVFALAAKQLYFIHKKDEVRVVVLKKAKETNADEQPKPDQNIVINGAGGGRKDEKKKGCC